MSEPTDFITVCDWERHQHYKQRSPPWIKLYRDVLTDYDVGQLPDADRWLLVGLWLLAAETSNAIPADPHWIGQRLTTDDPVTWERLDRLQTLGFIDLGDSASKMLAKGDAQTEKRRETEKENNPPHTPPTAPRGVENSTGHTSGSLALEADRVLGHGTWFGGQGELHRKYHETRELIWRNWLGRGVSPDRVHEAIHGLRLLVDEGKPEWLADRKNRPIDSMAALVNTNAVVPVGDGESMISLFAAAVQRYDREQQDTSRPATRGEGGPTKVSANLDALLGDAA